MAIIIAGERSGAGKTTITLALLAALCRGKIHQLERCQSFSQSFSQNGGKHAVLPDVCSGFKQPSIEATEVQIGSTHPLNVTGSSTYPIVQSFKVGPDYIDPMFHRYVTDRPCRNLDPVLTSEAYVRSCFSHHTQNADYALVEGVMGLFDGVAIAGLMSDSRLHQIPDFASTAHIARLLDLPIVLVVDCSRLSGSVAAIVHGYQTFDSRLQIAGVILNRVASSRHRHLLTTALKPLQMPVLGLLCRHDNIAIPDRYLGLVPTDELPHLDRLITQLTELGESCFDWPQLIPLLRGQLSRPVSEPVSQQTCAQTLQVAQLPLVSSRNPREVSSTATLPLCKSEPIIFPLSMHPVDPPTDQSLPPQFSIAAGSHASPRIAIAYDRAFSFYYADNLELLQAYGAELVFWSPLDDRGLPQRICGLYLGGGFPEVFASALAENRSACKSVGQAIRSGLPTYAECGGVLYLCEQLVDFEGRSHPMVGIVPAIARMGKSLTLGYRRAIALCNSPVVCIDMTLWGHEFHRSHLTPTSATPASATSTGSGFHRSQAQKDVPHTSLVRKPLDVVPNFAQPLFQIYGSEGSGVNQREGWRLHQLHASYVHLHWGTTPEIAARFVQQCRDYQAELSGRSGRLL